MLGGGSLQAELRGAGPSARRRDAVHLGWRVGDVAALAPRADVFVHPARWEGFGLALLEAMLARVARRRERRQLDPRDRRRRRDGDLVPADDPSALAAALDALLADPALRAAYGGAGLERAAPRLLRRAHGRADTIAVYARRGAAG